MNSYQKSVKSIVENLIERHRGEKNGRYFLGIKDLPSKDFKSCQIGVETDDVGDVKSLSLVVEISSESFSSLTHEQVEDTLTGLSVQGYECDIQQIPNSINPSRDFFEISIKLNYTEDLDIYLLFVSGILSGVAKSVDKNGLIALIQLLGKWKNYFESTFTNDDLNHEQQIGLWGELYVLKDLINSAPLGTTLSNIVDYWLGPDKEPQDFLCEKNAIEVKTTYKKNRVNISSLKQLDHAELDVLWLSVLRLKEGEEGEEGTCSLFALVNHLQELLSTDEFATTEFSRKLVCVKYKAKEIYDKEVYSLASESRYRIDESLGVISRSREAKFITRASYSIDIKSDALNEALIDSTVSNLEFLENGME